MLENVGDLLAEVRLMELFGRYIKMNGIMV